MLKTRNLPKGRICSFALEAHLRTRCAALVFRCIVLRFSSSYGPVRKNSLPFTKSRSVGHDWQAGTLYTVSEQAAATAATAATLGISLEIVLQCQGDTHAGHCADGLEWRTDEGQLSRHKRNRRH